MFCEKCGTKIPEGASFCTNCGASISEGSKKNVEKLPDTNIQLHIKPTYKTGYMILPFVFAILICSFSLGIPMLEISPRVALESCLIVSIFILFIFEIFNIFNKKQYEKYEFNFYRTKVIYKSSFFYLLEKEVKYKYISEIIMSQNVVQRFFNIGNIILFTDAKTYYGNRISIINVEDVEEKYKNIKKIIDF